MHGISSLQPAQSTLNRQWPAVVVRGHLLMLFSSSITPSHPTPTQWGDTNALQGIWLKMTASIQTSVPVSETTKSLLSGGSIYLVIKKALEGGKVTAPDSSEWDPPTPEEEGIEMSHHA